MIDQQTLVKWTQKLLVFSKFYVLQNLRRGEIQWGISNEEGIKEGESSTIFLIVDETIGKKNEFEEK